MWMHSTRTPDTRQLLSVQGEYQKSETNLCRCLEQYVKFGSKINIETRRSTTLKQRVILVQGPFLVQGP